MRYTIVEIPVPVYARLIKPVFDAKNTHAKQKIHDPFLGSVMGECPLTTNVSQKLGSFHEKLLASFEGYVPIKGLDIMSVDGKEVFEVKNRSNTMNSKSVDGLQRTFDKYTGCKKYLIQINGGSPRHGLSNDIIILTGKDAYTKFSKSSTFYTRLLETFDETFKFKTFEEFAQSLYQLHMLSRLELRSLFDDIVVRRSL